MMLLPLLARTNALMTNNLAFLNELIGSEMDYIHSVEYSFDITTFLFRDDVRDSCEQNVIKNWDAYMAANANLLSNTEMQLSALLANFEDFFVRFLAHRWDKVCKKNRARRFEDTAQVSGGKDASTHEETKEDFGPSSLKEDFGNVMKHLGLMYLNCYDILFRFCTKNYYAFLCNMTSIAIRPEEFDKQEETRNAYNAIVRMEMDYNKMKTMLNELAKRITGEGCNAFERTAHGFYSEYADKYWGICQEFDAEESPLKTTRL